MWVEINAASEARDKALNNASTTAANIKANIEELKAIVADGRADMLTAQNSSLLQAEEAISRVLYQIQTAETEVAKALGESKVVNEYKDIIEKGKEQFKKELEAILPDVKLGQQVNEENLNILIAHAYRRVEHLQRQLAKQAVTEQNRVQKAMENQKEEDSKIADTQVSIELANQQREQEIAHQKGINDLKEELELELRQQLRRQAAAHNDHLQEVLFAQQKEMDRKHELNLKDKLLQEKTRQLSELADAITKLKSIEVTLKAHEQLDTAARKAQQLWLACQALKQSIKSGQPDQGT
ncbi:MICOS complex subunit Mic60-like isoform X1 [Tachypleus tridentatus]|uniref:MICOS complex subunit Mic60-like isoform X1 n=2 Tax=Tachypleus tridentatus TaxID=6853 RepID=UPI003FD276CA